MNSSFEVFLNMLISYLNGKKFNTELKINWNDIVKLAEIHNVQGMIYIALQNSSVEIPSEVLNTLNKAFVATVTYSVQQEMEMERVKSAFKKANVDMVLMKGYLIKKYYPSSELRTMGDVDFLIRAGDRQKSDEVLKSIGFEFVEKESGASVWNYIKGNVLLEVHTSIIYQQLFLGIDYSKYFSNVFNYIEEKSPNIYEMKPEYHFIYVLVHFAKHLYRVGSGIRMVMDVVVLLNKCGKDYDWDFIWKELEDIKLLDFTKRLFCMCYKYFDCYVPENCKNGNDKVSEAFMVYVLKAGIFGQYNRDSYSVKFNLTEDEDKTKKIQYRVKNLLQILFPDYDTMYGWFAWFRGKPKWYLPIGWVRRWIVNWKYKRESIFQKIKGAVIANEDSLEHNEIMKKIGLFK